MAVNMRYQQRAKVAIAKLRGLLKFVYNWGEGHFYLTSEHRSASFHIQYASLCITSSRRFAFTCSKNSYPILIIYNRMVIFPESKQVRRLNPLLHNSPMGMRLLDLPVEILLEICSFVGYRDFLNLRRVRSQPHVLAPRTRTADSLPCYRSVEPFRDSLNAGASSWLHCWI
jgi:hypothetical protein